jgi:hypothetical protein
LKNKLPTSVKLIFENKYIDYINILCALYSHKRRKKGINFNELVYWYTLSNCIVRDDNNQYNLETAYLQNNYLNYESVLKQHILILANQGLVNVTSESIGKKRELLLSISQLGISLLDNFTHSYIKDQISKTEYLKKVKPYTSNNEKGVLINQ